MDICKALIGHYIEIQNHNEEALRGINQTIKKQLRLKNPDTVAAYETALDKLERAEDNMRKLLAERRNKKFSRLAPRVLKDFPHTHKITHTHSPQATTPGRKRLGQFPVRGGKGKAPSPAKSSHTPYRRPYG